MVKILEQADELLHQATKGDLIMIQMIAQIVADAYKDYAGLDEIKRGIRIAMAVCAPDLNLVNATKLLMQLRRLTKNSLV